MTAENWPRESTRPYRYRVDLFSRGVKRASVYVDAWSRKEAYIDAILTPEHRLVEQKWGDITWDATRLDRVDEI